MLNLIEQTVPKGERGDVLVFLSGAQEISCLQEELEGREGWIVLPLHSALPIKQQDKVFLTAPEGIQLLQAAIEWYMPSTARHDVNLLA